MPAPPLRLLAPLSLALGCSLGVAEAAPAPDAASLSRSIEATAATASPSVVQVLASGYVTGRQGGAGLVQRRSSTGSGVIVSAQGHVITNAHVVLGAEQIELVTADRKAASGALVRGERIRAELVGFDIDSDIAVLVAPLENPRPIVIADSNAVRTGQLALALGSPLGLEGSVSMGIVSAVDRQANPDGVTLYLQTDASINPGSSGGPLVDALGRMIGINTFILSGSGGSQGLGFAVPSNTVREVYEQVRDLGRVVHGTVGAHVQTVTPELAGLLGLSATWGALVTDVDPHGPAAAVGIDERDIITHLNGVAVESAREFNGLVHAMRPGSSVRLSVTRKQERLEIEVELAARPGDPGALTGSSPKESLVAPLGVLAITVDDRLRAQLPELRAQEGALVAIVSDTRAAMGGLAPGDVILGINRAPVRSLPELRRALAGLSAGTTVAVEREREGLRSFVLVELE